jgi:hypothetical protein
VRAYYSVNYARAYGGGVYLESGSAITKTGGTINAGSLSRTTAIGGDMGGAAVYVDCTDNPAGLENDLEADHYLTKAAADTTESSLTHENGWTGE